MTYADYYDATCGDKENGVVHDNEFELSEHLRFSSNSYRESIDENSAALKDYDNYRYSQDSYGKKSAGSGSHRDYRESKGSSYSGDLEKSRGGSRSSANENRRHTNASSKVASRASEATNTESCDKTIALFGINGVTGHYFLQLAVEAGYHVRALILPGFELEDMKENPSLTLVHGTMDDQAKIHRVIRKAAFVVCMLNDCPQTLETTTPPTLVNQSNYDFIQKLVPLMSRCSNCKILLYQASSFARDTQGPAPVITNVVKKMAVRKTRREVLQEQDKIVKFISKYQKAKETEEEGTPFNYIITRPSEIVWDRPSRKKLEASKSLPGPFPITNVDLAEFSLNALKCEKLYNSCPYVVQDGF